MRFTSFHEFLAAAAFAVALVSLPLCAQDAGSKEGLAWKQAQQAFGSGDFEGAAKSLEGIISASQSRVTWMNPAVPKIESANPKQQRFEPVLFMLGAAYFNAKDWPKAIFTFTRYLQLFPQSKRRAQVTYSLAQADFFGEHMEDAIPLLVSLMPSSDYRTKVLLLLVEAYKKSDRTNDAIALLEKERNSPSNTSSYRQKLNMKLIAFYLPAGDDDKTKGLLQEINNDIAHVPNIMEFNVDAIKLGDSFLAKNRISDALSCYRIVRSNEQVSALAQAQIDDLKNQRSLNLAAIQANPFNSTQLQLDNQDIDKQIAESTDALAKYNTLAPIQPPLFLRIGRAYYVEKKLWEAAVLYRELMRRFPTSPVVEPALYGSIVIFDQLKQTDRGLALCQLYLTQFPQGKYLDTVAYIRGALAFDAGNFDVAISYFNDVLNNQPNNSRREQIELIIGDIKLRQQKFDEAISAYQKYLKDYPNGGEIEQANYRIGLTLLFKGNYEQADQTFRDFIQKYPESAYVPDAEYRLAVIKFAADKYDEVIADCLAWQQKHAQSDDLAEVISLLGDAYAAEDKKDEAIDAYLRSYKSAHTIEVLNNSLFTAFKLLQSQQKWTDIATICEDFIKNNPEHPSVVAAIFWMGRADIKLGKVEEAKQFIAEAAKKYLNHPTRDAVDEIITQLAQLYARKHSVPIASTADAAPSSAAADASNDPAADLANLLTIPNIDSQPTARSRILFAKAELARIQRKPDVEAQILLSIAKNFKPEDLSSIVLGQVGDCLLQYGQPDEAVSFYGQLMDAYDESPAVDYAYNGLGKIAFNQKDYKKAEHYYFTALDKGLADSKLKEITLGEAQSLLALDRPEDAKPYFEQVASNRAWRGEATALSVYSLGEVQMALGKFPEANAYYQRVFVAYQKYPDIQAKAYLRSGEAFEEMGKTVEARTTYSEMLRNPALVGFPEASEAKEHLDHLTQ